MKIQIFQPFTAQPLDEEGDPVGEKVTLPPGKYEPMSGLSEQGTMWILDSDEKLFVAEGLQFQLR
jgi:hypothetical protein